MESRLEIEVRLTVAVGDREIEVPVAVPVTFSELAALVQRHLDSGEDVYGLLLEHYADTLHPRKPRRGNGRTSGSQRSIPGPVVDTPVATVPSPAANGESFTTEELAGWRGKAAPVWSGRGRKSRDRRLWEAANPE